MGVWMKLFCQLSRITLGKNCTFYGNPKFKKLYDSSNIIIGDNVCFRSGSTSNLIGINRPCILSVLTENGRLKIGDNCGFSGTVIGCFIEIVIGDNVKCGANTLITDSDWHPEDSRSGKDKPIYIEDNVWVGSNVIVLKGVRIGKNSLIGAGSVVVKDIPANVVAAGNPCKVIKNLL
jgi:acetyltransferase-like isoleucine patch superfamily enzyme